MADTLGMIGVGKMGLALAQQMIADGHAVVGYDTDPVRLRLLEAAGGESAANAREVAERSDITFTILLKDAHIEANLFGPDSVTAAGKPGHIHVEMSTMPPPYVKDLAGRLADAGVTMLDAPISGSAPQVDNRTITFMVGGPDEAWARVRPILEKLSADATHTGAVGTGATMKVVTNLFVNACTALLAEVVLTGERAGLSHDVMGHCLSKGSVRGAMLDMSTGPLFNRDFTPRGAVEIFVKDMGIAIELAKAGGIDLQVVPAARAMFQRAEAAGWGKDDATRVIEVYEGKA